VPTAVLGVEAPVGKVFAAGFLQRSSARIEMLFWEGRWVGVVLGMRLCKATV